MPGHYIYKRVVTLVCFTVFTLVFVYQRRLLKRYSKDLKAIRTADDKVVTSALMGNLRHMASIALPHWGTREGLTSLFFVGLFLVRSILYVMGSHADGRIMELILAAAKGDTSRRKLASSISFFAAVKMMQAATGGLIEHVRHHLIASYRKILTRHFHDKFFNKLTYYHATAIDSRMRLEAADTVIPIYCGEFAEHFAELPYYFIMPFFDASVSLLEVVRQVGTTPALGLLGVAGVFLGCLKTLTPPFGRIHALLLHREEEFKKKHSDVQTSVEQIALMQGGNVSKMRANYSFDVLMRSLEQMAVAKGFFQLVEDAVGGCCWELVGFLVSWFVVKTRMMKRNRQQQLGGASSSGKSVGGGSHHHGGGGGGGSADKLLSSMVVQRRLVTDFHVAITAMVVNIKEVSHLSEFTEKLAEFDHTLDSIARGEFARFIGVSAAAANQNNNTAAAQQFIDGNNSMAMADSSVLLSMDNAFTTSAVNSSSFNNVQLGPLYPHVIANSADANNKALQRLTSTDSVGSFAFSPEREKAEKGWNILRSTAAVLHAHKQQQLQRQGTDTTTGDDVQDPPAAAAALDDDATIAARWHIGELEEEGWVPCVMAPALHHATYTTTTTEANKNNTNPRTSSATNGNTSKPSPLVTFTNTDVCTPNGKLLIHHLNMEWLEGQSWAISGPNGCGKSSLLRVLAQTWLPSGGIVGIHPRVKFIYVPQTPYFPPDCTLAEQILYPDVPSLVPFAITEVPVQVKNRHSGHHSNGSATRVVMVRKAVPIQQRSSTSSSSSPSASPNSEDALTSEAGSQSSSTSPADAQSSSSSSPPTIMTAMTAPDEARNLMVCPLQQQRMKEALQLATGRQLLSEVIHGWDSPLGGLYNPHHTNVRRSTSGKSGESATPDEEGSKEEESGNKKEESGEKHEDATPSTPTTPVTADNGQVFGAASSPSSPSSASSASYTVGTFSGCDRSLSWPSLSGGQQQKLSLSRAFYQSLKAIAEGFIPIVVMDESTSQMDEASEDAVFRHLNSKHIPLLSVSHRKEVVLRHTHILQLARDPAAWRIVEVNEHTVSEALEI